MSHLFALDAGQVATNGDDWYTPRWIFDAAGITFDMDVASPMDREMQQVPARRYLTALDDGLATRWVGSVWCNPPYSGSTPWVEKWAAHDGPGMLLVPAVKSRWVGDMLKAAEALTLLTVEFIRPGGEVAPIRWLNILAGKGDECAEAVARVAARDKHAAGGYFVRGVA
jgi:phage N-6-adenine-methyltransferase